MKRKPIHIHDIPYPAFTQFQSGRRYSGNFVLDLVPFIGQNVVLYCEKMSPSSLTPSPIHTTVTHVISLDTMLASTNYYALTFRL